MVKTDLREIPYTSLYRNLCLQEKVDPVRCSSIRCFRPESYQDHGVDQSYDRALSKIWRLQKIEGVYYFLFV